jgi:hypothetical protein
MHKLKLESLQIESFETTSPAVNGRGTVNGHIEAQTGDTGQVYTTTISGPVIHTYNVRDCGETRYFDCTYGCTMVRTCGRYCSIYEPAEPVENTLTPTIVAYP